MTKTTKSQDQQLLDTLLETSDQTSSIKTKEKCLDILKAVYESRIMDEKMGKLVRQNKGGTFHMNALGHELVGVIGAKTLVQGKDWGLPYYRDRGFAVGFGCCPIDLLGVFIGREVKHHSMGRMMPDHFSHKGLNIPVQSSVVGSQFLQAVGLAKGLKLSGKNEAVYVSAGDGATSQGDFHEALNFSCLHKLGVIFVIQDNGWAISVPVKDQTAGGTIAKIAKGYEGLTTHEVDGTSFEELTTAYTKAVEKARNFEGPSLIVAKVPRLGPHSSSDDPKKYKSDEMLEDEEAKDPIPKYEEWLMKMGLFKEEELLALKDEIKERVDLAAKEAEKIPFPSKESVKKHIFQETEETSIIETNNDSESVVMVDAINHALKEEMQSDAGIVVFGQDVAHGKGGVFGVTKDLTSMFTEKRCFNSPLAESTIIGTAIGMSFDGIHKPVVEIQFADYLWTGINQLFNELSSIHYRSAGEWNCPVVVRMPTGGYIQGGPYHSQSIEAFLAHCPGLKIVLPSNAEDAKRLIKAAIRDPNPVIFLEHKGLYRQRAFSARKEPKENEVDIIGKAKVVREGQDLTLITWGMATVQANEICEKLYKEEDIEVELIDLRTIAPVDYETIAASVRKTSKVLIAHEAPKNCGFGAELAARIAENEFEHLDAPIKRIGSFECAVPYSKVLEDAVLPQKDEIEEAIKELASF